MKCSLACSILLLGELASAKFHGLNAFKKAERPVEKRHPTVSATLEQPRLRKRASPFYTDKTKRRSKRKMYDEGQALTFDSFLGEWLSYS